MPRGAGLSVAKSVLSTDPSELGAPGAARSWPLVIPKDSPQLDVAHTQKLTGRGFCGCLSQPGLQIPLHVTSGKTPNQPWHPQNGVSGMLQGLNRIIIQSA